MAASRAVSCLFLVDLMRLHVVEDSESPGSSIRTSAPARSASSSSARPFGVRAMKPLKPSSSPLGEPFGHTSETAISASSPMASAQILQRNCNIHLPSSRQRSR